MMKILLIVKRLWDAIQKKRREVRMFGGIQGWFKSKKGWAFMMALVTLILGDKGLDLSPEIIKAIVAVAGVYIGAQGAADFGKEKAQLEKEKAAIEGSGDLAVPGIFSAKRGSKLPLGSVVQAYRLVDDKVIAVDNRKIKGYQGEWHIVAVDGGQWFAKDDKFRKAYKPENERAKELLGE